VKILPENRAFRGPHGFDTGEKSALAYGGFSKKTAIHAARAPIAGQMDARDAAREISDE